MILLIHIIYGYIVYRLIRRDNTLRPGVSAASWIPTLWLGILASKPLTFWVGFGGGEGSLEGSPLDALSFFVLIASAAIVLNRRKVSYTEFISKNWALLLFYFFFFVSILWANSPFASLKRWIKEFGNILIVIVVLTESNPLQTLRAVCFRIALALIPLSIIYIRFIPDLGRRYSRAGGLEITGVTTQKNSLGAMILVCGLILLWDWIERRKSGVYPRKKFEQYLAVFLGCAGVYVLYLSRSQTSALCLAVGSFIIASMKFPVLQKRVSSLGFYGVLLAVAFFIIDKQLGVSESIVRTLGRDMTFTGRTEVWKVLLNVGTNPIIGTGFMSFWDDAYFRARLPYWVSSSAHNGYVETYLAGGYIGVAALTIMLLGVGLRINQALATQTAFSVVRFAILVVVLLANFSESNFGCMTPVGFLMIIAGIGTVPQRALTTLCYRPTG